MLALEGIDTHDGMGILKELVLLQEPEGEAVLPHYQFCGCDQHLERLTRWRGKYGFGHGPPHPWCRDNAPKAHQHEHTETREPSHRHPFLVRQHTPDRSLIVLGLGLYLHESEHPVKKMPTDVANDEIDTWLRLWGDNQVCPYTLFRRKLHGF